MTAPSPHAAPNRVSPEGKQPVKSGGIAADQLRSLVERIERLEEEKAGIASDIKDIFAEAKGAGFDQKTLRKVIALRRQDAAERDEAEHLLDTYCRALGMQAQFEFDPPEQGAINTEDMSDDDFYPQAVSIVVRDRNASTSYLQRTLATGYNRAARLIERMEREGIVGPANHIGKREVLRQAE